MGDHIFAYLMVIFFGLMGLYVLTYGIFGFFTVSQESAGQSKRRRKICPQKRDRACGKIKRSCNSR